MILTDDGSHRFVFSHPSFHSRLQKIDAKGSFRSDDEIGWFFQEVLAIQKRLNNFKLIEPDERKKG